MIEVTVKTCCGAMTSDWCDCAAELAEVIAALAAPIEMAPPERWSCTGGLWEVTR